MPVPDVYQKMALGWHLAKKVHNCNKNIIIKFQPETEERLKTASPRQKLACSYKTGLFTPSSSLECEHLSTLLQNWDMWKCLGLFSFKRGGDTSFADWWTNKFSWWIHNWLVKVCSVDSDIDLCSACHVYPISRGASITLIQYIVNRFTWGLD